MLGSFDPFHRGHQCLCSSLLAPPHNCSAVLLLIPEVHFEKSIVQGKNASLLQRVDMLKALYANDPRVGYGIAHEVLFVRLSQGLSKEIFPSSTEIIFGMGHDRYDCMLDSVSYFNQLGLEWTVKDQMELNRLQESCIVFSREDTTRSLGLSRGLSSTLVRQAIVHHDVLEHEVQRAVMNELNTATESSRCTSTTHTQSPRDKDLKNILEEMVDPVILSYIKKHNVYSGLTIEDPKDIDHCSSRSRGACDVLAQETEELEIGAMKRASNCPHPQRR